ncbi:MAG: T9SS type A sorting domain-containing protein [Saprospiraceae bacterium]
MFSRKLLLIALFTGLGLFRLTAQNNIHVHGTITDNYGNLLPDINVLITALYSDSTVLFESVYTGPKGDFSSYFAGPPPNFFGTIEVSMVDCFGTLSTQVFTTANGGNDFQADFTYCNIIPFDSCAVYIIQESIPGTVNSLTAYTYANVMVSYIWSTGETTQTIYPGQPGTYCVDVIFPWGCIGNDCYVYNNDTTGTCFGYIVATLTSNGTYHLEAYDLGAGPFTFLWSTGETSSGIDSVYTGAYCVTITDTIGCAYAACILIGDPNNCSAAIYEGQNGGLVAYGSGPSPLVFSWNTGESTQSIYPAFPGTYCVTITDVAGCAAEACYKYGIFPDSCYVYVFPVYIDSVTVGLQAISGIFNSPVTYLWSNGDTTDTVYPLDPSQTYCVTITSSDSNCVAEGCFDNNQYCYAWVDVQYVDTNTAVLTVYSDPIFGWPGSNTGLYVWSTGDTGTVITVHDSGDYCVTATLSTNCVSEACGYVDFDGLQNDCSTWVFQYQDPATGQWYAEAQSWGYGTFSYLWSNGDTNAITPIAEPNSFVCVTATSSFGCVSEACVDTTFSPCQVYINENIQGNTAVLSAETKYGGAINNGTFVWSNGLSGPVITVTEEGTYCVTFTSADGCTSEACIDVFFWNNGPCGVWINFDDSQGISIYSANAWGVPPFTYLWSNGATGESVITDLVYQNLCVTVTDSVGCVSSACSQIDTLNPNNGVDVISGFVFADSVSHVKGEVLVYNFDANSGQVFSLVDSTQTGDYGYYEFRNLPAGVYLLKAKLIPGSVGAAQYIPTYHLSSTTWEDANPHILPNLLPITTDITMKHVTLNPGSGGIGGIVTDPHHIVAKNGEAIRGQAGLPNVEVLLKDAQGVPLDFVYTAADGSFSFQSIAFGTYRISYDIPGIHSPDIWVTINAEDPDRLQITLVVNQGTTSIDQQVAKELNLYPNPAKNEVNIRMPVLHATYDIQIVDMQGRIVYTGSIGPVNGILSIEVGQLSSGLFHINLKGENEAYYSRFLKLE